MQTTIRGQAEPAKLTETTFHSCGRVLSPFLGTESCASIPPAIDPSVLLKVSAKRPLESGDHVPNKETPLIANKSTRSTPRTSGFWASSATRIASGQSRRRRRARGASACSQKAGRAKQELAAGSEPFLSVTFARANADAAKTRRRLEKPLVG